MEERIRFIEHKGKQVFLVDMSNCTAEELEKYALLVPSYVTSEKAGSVLLLADFTGAQFDRLSIERLKVAAVFDRPHLKKSAWVGADKLPKVVFEHIRNFSRRDLPTFKTREEALDWLVSE